MFSYISNAVSTPSMIDCSHIGVSSGIESLKASKACSQLTA